MPKEQIYFGEVLLDFEVDRILSTILLSLFFLIGSFGNIFYIHIHVKQRSSRSFLSIFRRQTNNAEKRQPPDAKKLDAKILRNKTKINNDAVFASSIVNCIICLFYIPYTIVVRIWAFKLPDWPCRTIEWFKDSFLYFNFFMLTIIAFERYVAICRTNYYKTLEKRINKIIWFFYFIALALSVSNFYADMKCSSSSSAASSRTRKLFRHNSSSANASSSTHQHAESSISRVNFNFVNLLVSMVLFGTNAFITTIFYARICVFYSYLIRKRLSCRPKRLEPLQTKIDDRKSCDAAVLVSQIENNLKSEERKSSAGSYRATQEKPQVSKLSPPEPGPRIKRTRSKIFIRSKSTPNIQGDGHLDFQKRSTPLVTFKRTNKNTITKISVMVSSHLIQIYFR